jgi:hypothetical protein
MGPRADAVANGNIPCPCRQSNPGRLSRSPVTVLTELPRLLRCAEVKLCMCMIKCTAVYPKVSGLSR